VRDLAPNRDKLDTINGLFMALYKAGFIYKTRVKIEEDKEGNPVKKQII
jgi:hypothetical protein